MYYRKVNDPISPHSERLVSYMNTHPATILGYAKYYGEIRSAVSARMVDIDSNGFMVEVEEENGSKSEVHIKFKIRLRSYEEVRPTLTRMAQEAEDALGLVKYILHYFYQLLIVLINSIYFIYFSRIQDHLQRFLVHPHKI